MSTGATACFWNCSRSSRTRSALLAKHPSQAQEDQLTAPAAEREADGRADERAERACRDHPAQGQAAFGRRVYPCRRQRRSSGDREADRL